MKTHLLRVRRTLLCYGPELLLSLLALYFAFRELGSFPEIWGDEGLFLVVARSLADGRGYVLPTFTYQWPYPNILMVGPPLLLPVALSIRILGFSMAAARLPMALYILGSCVLFYIFTKRAAGHSAARWATGLLITLSAFVNTGKPVLGEVPGFFFLLLGLLALQGKRRPRNDILAGLAFGLAAVTKLTYGLALPALLAPWLIALVRRQWKALSSVTVMGLTAALTLFLWTAFLFLHADLAREMNQFLLGNGGTELFVPLRQYLRDLVRFQYVYFDVLLLLSLIGIWKLKPALGWSMTAFIVTFIALNILHFVGPPTPPWYRYLLPAHLVLLPFVPTGARVVLHARLSAALLAFFILAQGYWQWDHRGSRLANAVATAAAEVVRSYKDTDLVVTEGEIFALLPQDNPHWYFVTNELFRRTYDVFPSLPIRQEQHCLPVVQRMAEEDILNTPPDRIKRLYGSYVVLEPPESCSRVR